MPGRNSGCAPGPSAPLNLRSGSFGNNCTHSKRGSGQSQSHISRFLDAAELGTIVPISNEAQARELAPLRDQPDVARVIFAMRHQFLESRREGEETPDGSSWVVEFDW